MNPTQIAIAGVYSLLLVGSMLWHVRHGPPYEQPTAALFLMFGAAAAMTGLASLALVFAPLHWTQRVMLLCFAAAMLLSWQTLFVGSNAYLVNQLAVLVATHFAGQAALVGAGAVAGLVPGRGALLAEGRGSARRLSLLDLLMLTTGLAVFFAAIARTRMLDAGPVLYGILIAGGGAAAAAGATAWWAARGRARLGWRVAGCLLVGPIGGPVYAVASRFEWLLFDWQWYAGVTSLQLVLMLIALTLAKTAAPAAMSNGPPGDAG